jgi:1,4-alpha-glucan branching enzyme
MHHDDDLRAVSGGDVLDEEPARHQIALPEGSWGEGGYHYIWLNEDNHWTWERLYPAQRKMRQMSRHWAGGAAREVVEQAGRELLLAESSDWQFLISTFSARDYAEVRFEDHIARFERLASMAEYVHAGNSLTVADADFLRECREKDAAFQGLDAAAWKPLKETLMPAGGVTAGGT